MGRADVLVVGGGIIGLAIARHLGDRGASVLVIERGKPGEEASSAAAGMLSPLAEAVRPGPFLDLLLAAREGFPAYCEELRSTTGIDVGYRDEGTLMLALKGDDEEELEERYRWQAAAHLAVERLDAAETLRLEPAVNPRVRWSLHFPGDHQVDNRRLSRSLWSAAAESGVTFRLGAEANRLILVGNRVEAVELTGGERLRADTILVAGGSWAGRLHGLPRRLPVEPVHGQLIALEVIPPLLCHVLDSPRCYLVPRADGRLIIGATVERRGFLKAVTPAGVLQLLHGATEAVPALRHQPVVEMWSGLRPGTPDGLPILGRDPEVANLYYATGHFRNGILLAPLTAELLGELVLSGTTSFDLSPFEISRFGTDAS